MTDATVPTGDRGVSVLPRWVAWLFLSRSGLLSIWIVLALGGLFSVPYWHLYVAPLLDSYGAKALLLAASTLLWLPIILLFLDSPDNYAKGPRPWLPLLTLFVLVSLALFASLDTALRWQVLVPDQAIEMSHGLPARVAFAAFFLLAFVPRVWNAANFARFDETRRKERARDVLRERARQRSAQGISVEPEPTEATEGSDAESMGALLATAAVTLIGILAFLAGNGTSLSLQSSFGFFLCFSIIGIFFIVVCIDALSELGIVRGLSRTFEGLAKVGQPLARFYEWVDAALVRIGAGVAGMGHSSMAMRYAVLVGTLGSLCLMGWYLPPPYGLFPAFLGFVLAMAVSRLWSWVEDDRALAALTEYRVNAPYRTGFREDFRDETLLGFTFVFLLAPIAMMQANDGAVFGAHLFSNADNRHIGDWIGFFGIELAKAIPVVDWAEIYGVQTSADMIAINGPASRHAVFLARVMVDLVLIAALLQAVSIWTRSRQQKQLYRAGHIDRLDPFVERVELARAVRATTAVEGDSAVVDLSQLRSPDLVDLRRYNEGQLRTLYHSSSDLARRSFIEAIATQRGMPLSTAIDLTVEIAEGHRNEYDLVRAFEGAIQAHRARTEGVEPDDLYRVLAALTTQSGLRAFKEKVVDMLEEVATPEQVIDLLSGLADGLNADRFQYARRNMARAIARAAAKLGRA